MISIKVAGEFLDIEAQSISTKKTSPIFTANTVYGDYTDLPFMLADTPKNHRIIQFAGQKSSSTRDVLLDCQVFIKNNFLASGKLQLKEVNGRIKVVLLTGISELKATLKNTSLRSIDFEAIDYSETFRASVLMEQSGNSDDLVVYYVDTDHDEWFAANATHWKTITIPDSASGPTPDVQATVDWINDAYAAGTIPFYAEYIDFASFNLVHTLFYWGTFGAEEFDISDMDNLNGWDCTENRVGSTNLATVWSAYVTTTNADAAAAYKFPVVYNDHYDSIGGFYLNYVTIADVYTNGRQLPMFRLAYTLKKLFLEIGYESTGRLWNDAWFNKILIFSNTILDMGRLDVQWLPEEGNPFLIDPKLYMPDMTIASFLRSIEINLGLVFFMDSSTRTVQVFYLKNQLTSTNYFHITKKLRKPISIGFQNDFADGFTFESTIDSKDETTADFIEYDSITYAQEVAAFDDLDSAAAATDDFGFVQNQRTVYKYNGAIWLFHAYTKDFATIGAGALVYKSAFCEIAMIDVEDDTVGASSRNWLIPHIAQPMAMDTNGQQTTFDAVETFGPKLLLWHGLQEDENANEYPLASQDTINYAGDDVGGNSLKFSAANTVLANTSSWYNHLINNSRTAELEIDCDAAQVRLLTPMVVLVEPEARYVIKEIKTTHRVAFDRAVCVVEAYLI